MTHEQITAIQHLIHPGDSDRVEHIPFNLAELKTLQGVVIDRIQTRPGRKLRTPAPFCPPAGGQNGKAETALFTWSPLQPDLPPGSAGPNRAVTQLCRRGGCYRRRNATTG